jgi:hypothetical protein
MNARIEAIVQGYLDGYAEVLRLSRDPGSPFEPSLARDYLLGHYLPAMPKLLNAAYGARDEIDPCALATLLRTLNPLGCDDRSDPERDYLRYAVSATITAAWQALPDVQAIRQASALEPLGEWLRGIALRAGYTDEQLVDAWQQLAAQAMKAPPPDDLGDGTTPEVVAHTHRLLIANLLGSVPQALRERVFSGPVSERLHELGLRVAQAPVVTEQPPDGIPPSAASDAQPTAE